MENRVYVKFGTSAEMERKMLMLREMMDNQIGETEYGILSLEVAGKAVFSPMTKEAFEIEVLGIEPVSPPEEEGGTEGEDEGENGQEPSGEEGTEQSGTGEGGQTSP